MEELEGEGSNAGEVGSAVGCGAVGFGAGALVSTGLLAASGLGGLSAAGITSGLTVMGGTMISGIVVFSALPVASAAAGAWGGYKAYKWWLSEG